MAFENLSEREKKVLACLISYYVKSADPVGSRVIANKFRLGLSPATIRNTMQDLEELGLVQQPHTSAGRIPTDAGYRIFVDRILQQEQITDTERRAIEQSIVPGAGLDLILTQTSRVLADLSSQLGITLSPRMDESVLFHIELIQMAEGKVLVVMAFRSGLARSILVEVDASIIIGELEIMSQVLNEKLAGLTLGQIRATARERLADCGGNPRLLRLFVESDAEVWNNLSGDEMHIGGTNYIISQPEFADKGKVQDFLKLIESRTGLIELLRDTSGSDSGIVITIGAENKAREIQSCSVVTATYEAGTTTGTISVIGPTRMPYARLTALVRHAARQLSKVLKGN